MNTTTQTPNRNNGVPTQGSSHSLPEPATILAGNIMTDRVIRVGVGASVQDIARLMSENRISAVPVIDGNGVVVGIVTEGDLLRRAELGTDIHCIADLAQAECVKARARHARDVMTSDIATITEETPLNEIVHLMETRHIKRLPVMRGGRLVGIVSRADIVRILVARPQGSQGPFTCDDDIIRFKVIETLLSIRGASAWLTTVDVSKGVVHLTGTVEDENTREPSRRAIERIHCVVAVDDHRSILNPY